MNNTPISGSNSPQPSLPAAPSEQEVLLQRTQDIADGYLRNAGYLSSAIQIAAEKGHLEVARFLLSDGRTISTNDLKESVTQAAANGHLNIVMFLLSKTKPQHFLGRVGAAIAGVFQMNDKTIDLCDLGSSVREAAANGHLEVVRFLLTNNISMYSFETAVHAAATNGHREVVRFLLTNNISMYSFDTAVHAAATNGHREVVRFLLSLVTGLRHMGQDTLERAVLAASDHGHLACVELLIQHGSIGERARNSAITNATGSDRDRIRDILRAARTVPDQAAAARPRDQGSFYVKFSDVREHPEKYLATLMEQGLPAHIYVIEESGQRSPAIDVGGITKQFVTSLCEAILAKEELLHLNSQGIPAKTGGEPTHQQLGRLFSLVYEANLNKTDKILTGYVVNERFLEMVCVVATADKEEEGVRAVSEIIGELDPLLLPSVNLVLAPTLENANIYLQSLQEDLLSEGDLEGVTRCVAEATQGLAPFYLAAKDFLKGTTERFRNAILSTNLQDLARSIQGEPLSVLGVLQSLRLAQEEALPRRSQEIIATLASQDQVAIERLRKDLLEKQEEEVLSTSFTDKINWLVAAIALKNPDQEADKIWLNKFFFAVTGKKTMSAGMTLRLQETWREGLVFEIHTCFNGLDLPAIALSRKGFLSALDFAIDTEGYSIA